MPENQESSSEKSKIVQLEHHLEELSRCSIDFLALLAAATMIATLGLFENSAAVIIGAMIIAPLMRPLVGLSLSLLTMDLLLLRRALFTIVIGSALGLGIAASMAVLLHEIELTPEILARAKPTLLDLGIAIFAGAIGAYCQTSKKLSDSLAGVAISVALVPPLSVVGIGLSLGQLELWQGAALLYLTNLVGIAIAGAIVFLVMGYAPIRRAKRGLVASAVMVLLLSIPLALSMNEMLLENRLSMQIRHILQEKTFTFKDVTLKEVEVARVRTPLKVTATVLANQQINSNQVRMVQEFLVKELNMPLEFKLKVIPLTEIIAANEEKRKIIRAEAEKANTFEVHLNPNLHSMLSGEASINLNSQSPLLNYSAPQDSRPKPFELDLSPALKQSVPQPSLE
jgi:uncharacterized hydrophobic protein (TIGR00271 family)